MQNLVLRLCVISLSTLSLMACQGPLDERSQQSSANLDAPNVISVNSLAHSDILNFTNGLDEILKSEMNFDDLIAAARERAKEIASKYDMNSDSFLDMSEMKDFSITVEEAQKRVAELDVDNDGDIDQGDIDILRSRMFAKLKEARMEHKENFAEKREEICERVEDMLASVEGEKFHHGLAMKHLLAKCADIVVASDADANAATVAMDDDAASSTTVVADDVEELPVDVVADESAQSEVTDVPVEILEDSMKEVDPAAMSDAHELSPLPYPTPLPKPDMICKALDTISIKANIGGLVIDALIKICRR